MSISARTNEGGGFPFILILAALAIAAGLLLATLAPAVPVYHDHAVAKHGVDAVVVRQCQQKGPVLQIWEKENGSDRFHCLFQMPDGRIGDQLVQLDPKGIWHEITAFARSEGTLEDVGSSLSKEAKLIYTK